MAILVLTQGNLAQELLSSAQSITGELQDFEALSLGWQDSLEEGRHKVQAVLDRLDTRQGVLILTDMYGSTPNNVALSFRDSSQVEVVTGVNLPMVVRLGCLGKQNLSLADMARWLRDKGRSSICLAESTCAERLESPCAEVRP
jgi:PTS system mannose-specific IIA component